MVLVMSGVVQRVSKARVLVDGRVTGEIGTGLVVLLGVGKGDTPDVAKYLAEKTATPNAGLSGHDSRPVYYDTPSDSFYVNPLAFFDRVTGTILTDFATYLGSLSPAHKLPTIVSPSTVVPGIVPTIRAFIPDAGESYQP
jgi:hypothetical protein